MNEVAAYTRLAGVYDEIVVDPCYARWADFLDGLWVHDRTGVVDVLDVCCGTGLMAAELVAREYRVVGVDAAPDMLDRARALLGSHAQFQVAVLPNLPIDETFDAAISNFDGLNYLPPSAFAETIAVLGKRVRPRGWLVFDVHTDAMMDFTSANALVEGDSDGNHFVISSVVDRAARTCLTTINVTHAHEGEPFVETHTQYFHSDEQIREALTAGGFTDVLVVDEYTYRATDSDTLRATWIARRGEDRSS
ncbi:MAG: methyltransferase domain-containing protein [Candidatus Nanopelagicales bacterium]